MAAAGNLSWLVSVALDLCVKTKNEIESSIRGRIESTDGQTIYAKAMFRTFSVLLTIAVLATPALAGRTTGVVKWYNAEKKMGFLQAPAATKYSSQRAHSQHHAMARCTTDNLSSLRLSPFQAVIIRQNAQPKMSPAGERCASLNRDERSHQL